MPNNGANFTFPSPDWSRIAKNMSDSAKASMSEQSGADVDVTQNITINNNYRYPVEQSWDDWQNESNTTALSDLMASLDKLSGILSKYDMNLNSIEKTETILQTLKSRRGGGSPTPHEMGQDVNKLIKYIESPQESAAKLINDLMTRFQDYQTSGGLKHQGSDEDLAIKANYEEFYEKIARFQDALKIGDVEEWSSLLAGAERTAQSLKQLMHNAVRQFTKYDKEEDREKKKAKGVNETRQNRETISAKDAGRQTPRAARNNISPPAGGGSVPPSNQPNNPPPSGGIRYFESLKELTDYLNNVNTGELKVVSAEIENILKSLNGLAPEAKNISAIFDNDQTLRGIALSAVSNKYGSAEVARMQYGFGLKPVDPEDEDSPLYYTVNRAQTKTSTFTDKIAKYQADLEAREQALITKLTAMHNLPIMQGDAASNGLLKQWEEIARVSGDGGIELIKKGSLSDIEEAESRFDSLKDSIKAINDLVTKKWANNSIEKMTENVDEMESMRKTLPNMFSKIGISNDDLFKDFDTAAARFHQAVDPKEQALAYNEMAKAIRTVKKTLTEENSAYNENIRLAKQQQKISHSSKVTLAGYKEKYDKMGAGRPEQYKKAREAKKRYDNARNAAERETAYRDYEQNMNWMKDDLAVEYPKWREKEKRSARLKKENSNRYWNGGRQTQQIADVRKELAELAQPYGGLTSDDLPETIASVLREITAAQKEKNPQVKSKRIASLKDAMKLAKASVKQSNDVEQANELLGQIASRDSLADTEVHNNLQDALYRVNSLTSASSQNEQADAWANLAANIKIASDAIKEYDKAQTDSQKQATAQERLNASYEQYIAQINTIKTAYEKMGKVVDTSKLEGEGGLLEKLLGADANDRNAVAEVQAKIRQELTQLRVKKQRDSAIYSAENQRNAKTGTLNRWLEGLSVDDAQLEKIRSLKALLESLGKINLNESGELEHFSKVMSQITETERIARRQVDTMQRYRRVTGDKDMELIDNGRLTAEQKTLGQDRRTALNAAKTAFDGAPDDVEALRKLNEELGKMEDYLSKVSKWDAFGKLTDQVHAYSTQLDLMKKKQGEVSKWKPGQQQIYNEAQTLLKTYNDQVAAGDMTGATDSANKLNNSVKLLNQSFESGGGFVGIYDGKIKSLATRMLGLGSGFMAFNKILGTVRKMAGYVTQIDTAMTELRKVTDETTAAYARFQKQSGQTAVKIGSSISDLINTSVEYGRMGYTLAESQQLGVTTTKFANTGNFNNVTEASDSLIAIIRGFDELDIGDAEAVSDKLTAVANKYAVTASDIATGLQRSASALNLGGVNVDQATAMITAISEVTRDSASAGNAIKTLSMRVRGAKTLLEEAGEDTSNMAESTSKLRAQVAALTNVNGKGGFDIMQDEDTYKSIYDIMLGISKVWDQMTDVKQSALLELLAGKVRSNQVAALLNNMSRAEEILHTSENAQGTMQEVHERWLDSIAAKQAQLTASWEQLSQTVMSSDVIKGWYQVGSDILNVINQIISGLGSVGSALTGIGITGLAGAFMKNGRGNILTGMMDAFTNRGGEVQGKAITAYNTALRDGANKLEAMAKAEQALGEGTGMTKATRFALEYSDGISNATNGMTILQMKMQGFKGLLKNLGANLLVSGVVAGVSWLADQGIKAIDRAANAEQYAVQAADDATAEHQEAVDRVKSIKEELANLNKQLDELESRKALNFVDEQAKNDLKQQTAELRVALDLAERLAKAKGKAEYNKQKNAWREQYSFNDNFFAKLGNWDMQNGLVGTVTGTDFVAEIKDLYNLTGWMYGSETDPRIDNLIAQIDKYVKKGLVGNDVTGSFALFDYLTELRDDLTKDTLVRSKAGIIDPETLQKRQEQIDEANTALQQMDAELTILYATLGENLDTMRENSDTSSPVFTNMQTLRNMIGERLFPEKHHEAMILELRKTNTEFDETYKKLEKLAETTEITEEMLNSAEFDGFREALKSIGLDTEDVVAHILAELGKLYKAPVPELSTTTASGLKTQIEGLLGNRTSAANIFKNTGYGANPISEDDYKTLQDMGVPDFMRAVEYSHGTAFFNMDTFNDAMAAKMSEQYDTMYKDMIAKQEDYVKESRKLEDALLEYEKARVEAEKNAEDKAAQEKAKHAREEVDAIAKNMGTIRDEIELYNRLGMQIKAASSAFGRWQIAKNAPQEGDNYDEALDAYKALQEGFASGRIGTAQFKSAQEYLLGANGNFYGDESQRKKLARYLTKSNPDDKSGADTGWGARNWQQDAIKAGILNADGSFKGNRSVGEIAELMGVGEDLVEHMFGELNEFITDESKKYKFEPKTVEEEARSEQYDEYLKRREKYEAAIDAYNGNQNRETLTKLIETSNALAETSAALGLEEPNLETDKLIGSQDNLKTSTDKNTGAIIGLTDAINGREGGDDVAPQEDGGASQPPEDNAGTPEELSGKINDVANEMATTVVGSEEYTRLHQQFEDLLTRYDGLEKKLADERIKNQPNEADAPKPSTGDAATEDFRRTLAYLSDREAINTPEEIKAYNDQLAQVKAMAENTIPEALRGMLKEMQEFEFIKTPEPEPEPQEVQVEVEVKQEDDGAGEPANTHSVASDISEAVKTLRTYQSETDEINKAASKMQPLPGRTVSNELYNKALSVVQSYIDTYGDPLGVFKDFFDMKPIELPLAGDTTKLETTITEVEEQPVVVKVDGDTSQLQEAVNVASDGSNGDTGNRPSKWALMTQIANLKNIGRIVNDPEREATQKEIDLYNSRLAELKSVPQEYIYDALIDDFAELSQWLPIVAKAAQDMPDETAGAIEDTVVQQDHPEPPPAETPKVEPATETPDEVEDGMKDVADAAHNAADALNDVAEQAPEEDKQPTGYTTDAQTWNSGNIYENLRNLAAYVNNREGTTTTPEAAAERTRRLQAIVDIPDVQIPGEIFTQFKELQRLAAQELELNVSANTTQANAAINKLDGKTVTVDVQANVTKVEQSMPGPSNIVKTVNQLNAEGTSNAMAGTSLVDEKGAELIEHVSRGTYELGTDNGPRFTQLDKGDIVHTAEDTKKIKKRGLLRRALDAFRNGGVKGGQAFAKAIPTKFNWASAPGSGAGSVGRGSGSDVGMDGSGALAADASTTGNKGRSGGGKKNTIADALKWAEKLVDWIPTALDIIKKKTEDYVKAAEKSAGYLAKNSELTNAIENVNAEIELNTRAVNRYKKQASDFATRAGLSVDIVKKIQEGTINIEEYDDNTRKAIQTYQTWWDKAKGCLDTIENLNDQLYDLSKQKLDNIVNYFSNIDDMLNQQIETYNKMVEVKEAYGKEMTRDDYLEAIKLTEQAIANLSEEQATLQTELDRQVESGVIKVGSDDWYNYAKQLEELNSTISQAKIDLSELNDEVKNVALNNLQTSIYYLDNLQTKIEGLQKLREAQGDTSDLNSYRLLISNGMEQIENIEAQNKLIRDQMEGLDELSEKYQELYSQLQDNSDKILEIKTSQEEWNDAILDMKISVLEKQNEKYQRQLNLMKALNGLEDARQRRVLLYDNEQGFHYVADEDAMESARDAINDQMYDLLVNGLEEQKSYNNIYDNMGNILEPAKDLLSGIDFSAYYDSINRGSETSEFLTNVLKNIDMPELLESTKGGDVSIDIGDIILNGVNDAQSLGDAIIAQLPGYLVQAIYSKGA